MTPAPRCSAAAGKGTSLRACPLGAAENAGTAALLPLLAAAPALAQAGGESGMGMTAYCRRNQRSGVEVERARMTSLAWSGPSAINRPGLPARKVSA